MIRRVYLFSLCGLLLAAAPANQVGAGPQKRPRLIQGIDESSLATLRGNTRPEATAVNDHGPVADDFPLEHMWLQLRRPPELERALELFIDELHNPKSPLFHHWLTAREFGERYGLGPQDLETITGWLQSQGFEVNQVFPNRVLIEFTGTAGQVRQAFHTEIHRLEVNGTGHFANMSDPQIPAALAPAVVGVVSMNDFRPHPMHKRRSQFTFGGNYFVVPADLATIYNFKPLFAKGISGQGQTIVVVEDTNVFATGDWTTFRSVLGLSGYTSGSFTQVHPAPGTGGACTDPHVTVDDAEAILDAEWASAAAPNATIMLASCANTTNFGGFIALQNLLSNGGTPPAIVSISYGDAETDLGAANNAYINGLYQEAVTAGVSVFVSSGDQAGAVYDTGPVLDATHGINASGFSSTPYNVSVGGTDFGDTFAGTNSTYWSATNTSTYGSALSYVPEIPWNDSCGSELIASFLGFGTTYGASGLCNSAVAASSRLLNVIGGSGGPSGCATGVPSTVGVVSGTCAGYAKPSWQSVFGNPNDSVRDLPDVSLFAANGIWAHAYVVCYSDTSNGGSACSGTPDTWSAFGGTSVSSPIMAGIQSLINQATGSRAGNPNPVYYSLARAEYGAGGNASCSSTLGNGAASTCIFYDVTQGDMDVPCYFNGTQLYNCYDPGGTSSNNVLGVLSTSNASYLPAFETTSGWDFATGIGTVNAFNLVAALSPNTTVTLTPVSLAFSIQPLHTSSGAKSVTLTNTGAGTLTLNSVTITGANSGDFGVTKTCTGTLAAGASCILKPTFTPTAPGPRHSLVSISDSAVGSPQLVYLSGVGTAASLSAANLSFAGQTVGTSSSPQIVTLTNTGNTAMHLWQIAILGANAGDFLKTTTCGSTLAPAANCSVSVTFKPTATGARSASLLFSDDGGGSPQAVGLSGTGM